MEPQRPTRRSHALDVGVFVLIVLLLAALVWRSGFVHLLLGGPG